MYLISQQYESSGSSSSNNCAIYECSARVAAITNLISNFDGSIESNSDRSNFEGKCQWTKAPRTCRTRYNFQSFHITVSILIFTNYFSSLFRSFKRPTLQLLREPIPGSDASQARRPCNCKAARSGREGLGSARVMVWWICSVRQVLVRAAACTAAASAPSDNSS